MGQKGSGFDLQIGGYVAAISEASYIAIDLAIIVPRGYSIIDPKN